MSCSRRPTLTPSWQRSIAHAAGATLALVRGGAELLLPVLDPTASGTTVEQPESRTVASCSWYGLMLCLSTNQITSVQYS